MQGQSQSQSGTGRDRCASQSHDDEPWTTRRLLNWISGELKGRGSDSPRLVAEMLLSHVLNCERMRLYMEVDRRASDDELAQLRMLVRRAFQHEPVQHLVGEGWFFGKPYYVSPVTMIPRPSTEVLVEQGIEFLSEVGRSDTSPRIADIGTGTGCVAITLAAALKRATIVATDLDQDVIDLATKNAQRHDVEDQIDFRIGNLLMPLTGGEANYDLIVSNPPYIPDHEWEDVALNVRLHEPERALRAGVDGLDCLRPLIQNAGNLLNPGGRLIVEFAHDQRDEIETLVASTDKLTLVNILKDMDELWRVAVAERVR